MKALKLMKAHGVEFNTLTCVTKQSAPHALEIYDFLKGTGTQFMQFIPIVERKPNQEALDLGLKLAIPSFLTEDDTDDRVMPWTVPAPAYGKFMIDIFDEWVRRDIGSIFVQLFDVALNAWMGMPPPLCVFAETCGDAMIIEHNGDLYSCDHAVYPETRLGNIMETPMSEMAHCPQQKKFGTDKRDNLPAYCRKQCEFYFMCHGACPLHRFLKTPNGDPNLNWLCEGYKTFFRHIDPYMKTMTQLLREQRPCADIMGMIPPKTDFPNP